MIESGFEKSKDNDKDNGFVIPAGMTLGELFEKMDVVGATIRYMEYREAHGLPQIYDVYTRQEDGSFEIKKGVEINK